MIVVGITGSIATGKSTVSNYLKSTYPLVDADRIARSILDPPSPAFQKVSLEFPSAIVNGSLDRDILGSIIFSDPDKRSILNRITHPYIRRELLRQVLRQFIRGESIVFVDVPLLFESRLNQWVHTAVVVYWEVQVERLMARNEMTREDAEKRVASQMSIELKKDLADVVLDNTGAFEETTIPQIEAMLKDLSGKRWQTAMFYIVFVIPAMIGWAALKLVEVSGL